MKKQLQKIVIICPYLFELRRGIERFCISLSEAFLDNNIKVIIYAWASENSSSCGDIDKRIKIRLVPNKRYFRDQIAAFFYELWLRIDNPDITILNFMYHGEEYLSKSRPYLYILHSPASQIPSRYEYFRRILPKFKNIRIISISKMVEQEALPYILDKEMSLIYNGTDVEKFKPSDIPHRSNKLRIISAAAFEPRKGMHYIIDALGKYDLRNLVEYHIYGSGDTEYESLLKEKISTYNLEDTVKLMGSVANLEEIFPMYDLFALPSSGEAFALSPIEAMACGLPVLVSDMPPYPEFVTSDFGFMVNREDSGDIISVFNTLLNDRRLITSMGENARRVSEEYSWKNVIKHYIDAINKTIL